MASTYSWMAGSSPAKATKNGSRYRRRAMSLNQPDIGAAFRKSLHDHWRAFLIEGIILVILGLAAITLPPLAGLTTAVVLGWLFLFGGIVGLVATFNQRNAPGFWWALFSAAIAVLAGGVLLAN